MKNTINRFLFACLLSLGVLPFALRAQNTLGGEAKIVPEAEVDRQSDFVDAESARMLGRYDKALELYRNFLRENPGNDAAWYGLAKVWYAKQDASNTLDAIGKAIAAAPDNTWYRIFQADVFEKIGQTKDAAQVYQGLTKSQPNVPEYWKKLAYLSVLSSDPKAGLNALDKLEKLVGVEEDIATQKHLIYVRMGDNKRAAAELQKLADAYPNELDYRHRLAQFYAENGDKTAADKVYAEILQRDPNDAVAKLALMGKSKAGNDATYLTSLLPTFRDPKTPIDAKVKELLPFFPKLDAGNDPALTSALLQLGAALEAAHTDDPKAWSISGDLLYHANRPAEALEKYRKCIQLNPTVFSVWENTLSILDEEHNYDEMVRLSEQAMDAFPNQPKAYYFYAVAAIEKGKYDEALTQLEQAALMVGNNLALRLDIIDQSGLALLRKGDSSAAISRYEQALPKGGDHHPALLEHFGDALAASGDRKRAREYWQKAYEIRKSPTLEQKLN